MAKRGRPKTGRRERYGVYVDRWGKDFVDAVQYITEKDQLDVMRRVLEAAYAALPANQREMVDSFLAARETSRR